MQLRYALVEVHSRHGRTSWCCRGTLVVRLRYAHGAVEVRLWCTSWCSRGTLPVLVQFGTLTFIWAVLNISHLNKYLPSVNHIQCCIQKMWLGVAN